MIKAGLNNKAVAADLGVAAQTVCKWRGRFVAMRLNGLADAPRTLDDARVAAIITKTRSERPRNATHWSTRAMSRESGVSHPAVCRIWHAVGLQPHHQETFKLA
jgi:transposase